MAGHRFSWKWYLGELKPDKPVKVFSTFSCGGGSSMGYKRAGFQVIGNVEIDPKINAMYVANNHPKYNYCMDLREFNKRDDLPEDLYHLDILDGSPPCTTFSTAGLREKVWGTEKKFAEGQKEQRLDDLFFVYLDTVEKLRPKVCVAENVTGLVGGNARGYVNEIVAGFERLGYKVQIFRLNAIYMDVPQSRERIFFIANNQGYEPLRLNFSYDPIYFGEVRSGEGVRCREECANKLMPFVRPGDRSLKKASQRVYDKKAYFGYNLVWDDVTCPTITTRGYFFRMFDKKLFNDTDFVSVSTFPQDYDFKGNEVRFVCGMSVPSNMMANIATEIWEQWLKGD